MVAPKVDRLIEAYPLLQCNVTDWWTRKPKWVKSERKWDSRDVVVVFQTGDDIAAVIAAEHTLSQKTLNIRTGPLLRVTIRPLPTATGSAKSQGSLLCVACHHCIGDGRSTLSMLHALLSDSSTYPSPTSELPPSAEDTIPEYNLSGYQIARLVFKELVVPNLPTFIRRLIVDDPAWPADRPLGRPPADCDVRRIAISVPVAAAARLKEISKAAGAGTIHPIFHACIVIALIVATSQISADSSHPSSTASDPPLRLSTQTPISLRNPKLGHPPLTGNYVGGVTWSFAVATERAKSLLSLVGHLHFLVHDPASVREGATEIGALKYLPELDTPDGLESDFKLDDPVPPNPKLIGHVQPAPTGWERYLTKQSLSPTPFLASLELSNLGALPRNPPLDPPLASALNRVWFAQTASPVGSAIGVDLVGCHVSDTDAAGEHVSGTAVSAVVSWRDGAIPTEVGEVFSRALTVTIGVVSELDLKGSVGAPEQSEAMVGLTVGDVCEKVQNLVRRS
ncbi:hypothetical protein HDU93_003125 [Gonapodya sp. JEL0774]|nr:hypothetical protein HDU93_003125 [Gonapodya sp. JEL0774]